MITAVDTNALIALLYDDAYADESESALRRAHRAGQLAVVPTVYAEIAADGRFATASELDQFLADFGIQVADPSREALFRVAETFQTYVDRRPDGLQCPECGATRTVACAECGTALAPRQHIAADFVVGGHAAVDADALVSFDRGFYESYFSGLTVLPEQ